MTVNMRYTLRLALRWFSPSLNSRQPIRSDLWTF